MRVWLAHPLPQVVPVDLEKTKRVAVNVPMELYQQAAQCARHDRRTISQWFRVAIEDGVKAQQKRLKEQGITLPEPSLAITGQAPEPEKEKEASTPLSKDDLLLKAVAQLLEERSKS